MSITLKHIIECALLAAESPLPLERLGDLFDASARPKPDELRRSIQELRDDYQERGIELVEVASGYRIQVRREMSPWIVRLWEERAPRYSRALLETLALIAYRQPITRAEIESVRGVSVSTQIMRTLLDRHWVRIVGHREVPGRPALYATTREFLDYFNLANLADLPPLMELLPIGDEFAHGDGVVEHERTQGPPAT